MEETRASSSREVLLPAPHAKDTYGNLCRFTTEKTFEQIVPTSRIAQIVARVAVLIEKLGRDSRETLMHLQEVFCVGLMMLRSCGVCVREIPVPLTESLICVGFRDVRVRLRGFHLCLCDRRVMLGAFLAMLQNHFFC